MAGIKLPDYTALGTPIAPQPPERVATYGNAEAPGAATMQLGQTAQQAGSNLQDLINVADVNNALANDFQPKVNALAADYYSKQGKAAMDAAPQFTQALQQVMDDSADGLGGQAQSRFKAMAQPIIDREMYRAATHSGEQARVYAAQSNDATLANHLSDYAQNIFADPPTAADAKTLAMTQLSGYLSSTGIDPASEIGKSKLSDLGAQFDKAQQGAIQQHFLSLPPDQQIAVAHSWMDKNAVAPAAPAAVKDVANAILGQESGNNPNAPTSVDGAVGKEQITPDTFAQYAKPGESIVSNTDRAAVFDRIMADYSQRYDGDPQRMAVAYFSGPGNVAPEGSATPWIRDVADGNGKSVSSYVSDINKRLGVPQAGTQTGAPSSNTVVSSPSYMGVPVPQEVASKLTEAALSNKEHADKLQKTNDESNFNQMQNTFFSKQHDGQLTWQDVQQSNLPVQGPGGKDWWVERLNKTDKTDPAVFNDLMQRALMPDGTPGKLTDPKELLGNVGHGITYTDMEHIQGVMQGGDPGKEALKAFWKQGHDQLSKTSLTDIDGEGERRAYNWQMATSKLIADGQKKGLSIQDMIDPQSKNYVGGNISQFQEDPMTQMNNIANQTRMNAPPAPLPAEKQRRAGESIIDYNKRLGIGA